MISSLSSVEEEAKNSSAIYPDTKEIGQRTQEEPTVDYMLGNETDGTFEGETLKKRVNLLPDYNSLSPSPQDDPIQIEDALEMEKKSNAAAVKKKRLPYKKIIFHIVSLLSGPLLSIPFYFDILHPGHPEVSHCAAVTIWMACWWFLEPVPVAVTSLLPVILFPILGLISSNDICETYFSDLTFLFLGSYLVAISLEKWECHRRFALFFLVKVFGVKRPKLVLLGFMVIAWFCSMWLSNTCTAAMLLPMASAILSNLDKSNPADNRYAKSVTIGIAYSCSIGGFSTLTGTGTNLVFVNTLSSMFPEFGQFSYLKWMLYAVPLSLLLIFMTYIIFLIVFVRRYKFGEKKVEDEEGGVTVFAEDGFKEQYDKLGPIKMEEVILVFAFFMMCLLWITREMPAGTDKEVGWADLLFWRRKDKQNYVTDATVAIFISVLLFIIPSKSRPGDYIMDWKTAADRVPWGLLLLFGAGLSLAKAFTVSKFSKYISGLIVELGSLPAIAILFILCLGVTFLTEVTSNVATASLLLPIVAKFSVNPKVHQNPLYFMIPATICTSCAFMSPVGTPPNAIAFAYGYVRMADMIKLGFILNLLSSAIIVFWMYIFGGPILGVHQGSVPSWANTTEHVSLSNFTPAWSWAS
jgi:sodium-dependent dicarboxylate transporter 2/3/5